MNKDDVQTGNVRNVLQQHSTVRSELRVGLMKYKAAVWQEGGNITNIQLELTCNTLTWTNIILNHTAGHTGAVCPVWSDVKLL